MCWVAVVLGVLQAVARFTQPVTVALGVPVAQLGWLYAGFTLLAAMAVVVALLVGLVAIAWLVVRPTADSDAGVAAGGD